MNAAGHARHRKMHIRSVFRLEARAGHAVSPRRHRPGETMRFARIEPGIVFAASLLAAVSGCVAPRAAAPPPVVRAAPPPVPPPRPAPAPAPAPVEDWRDIALTPGDWSYRNDAAGSEALFGDRALIVRCDTVRR